MSENKNVTAEARKPKSVNVAKYRRMNVEQLKSELQTFPAYLAEKVKERDAKIAEANRVHADRVKFCEDEKKAINALIAEKLAPPKPKVEKPKAAPKANANAAAPTGEIGKDLKVLGKELSKAATTAL